MSRSSDHDAEAALEAAIASNTAAIAAADAALGRGDAVVIPLRRTEGEALEAAAGRLSIAPEAAEPIARLCHETYESLAPLFGYETRKASAVPWESVPANDRALMTAVAGVVLERLSDAIWPARMVQGLPDGTTTPPRFAAGGRVDAPTSPGDGKPLRTTPGRSGDVDVEPGVGQLGVSLTIDPTDPRLTHGVDTEPVGQAAAYLVLDPVHPDRKLHRPVRTSYRHTRGCGAVTTMSLAIAETYARDPKFYGATYCTGCRMHKDVAEFEWVARMGEDIPVDQRRVGS